MEPTPVEAAADVPPVVAPTQPAEINVANVENVTSNATGPVNDTWTLRIAIIFIGLIVTLVIAGQFFLSNVSKTYPPEVLTLGAVGMGILGTFFVSSASQKQK